jgi:hypothetical protein
MRLRLKIKDMKMPKKHLKNLLSKSKMKLKQLIKVLMPILRLFKTNKEQMILQTSKEIPQLVA